MGPISLLTFIIVILEISLLIIIFFGNKDRSSRAFVLFVLMHAFWIISHVVFHETENQILAGDLIKLNYFLGGAMSVLFFYFTLVFPQNTKPKLSITVALVFSQMVFILLYFYDLIVQEALPAVGKFSSIQNWKWEYGSLWFLFDIFFFIFLGLSLFILYKKYRKSSGTEYRHLLYMFLAMLIGILPVGIVNVLLPRLNIFNFDWMGPILSIGWISALSYSIIRFKQMDTRTVLAKAFVVAAVIILFVNIFISGITKDIETAILASLKTLVFSAFISVGYLLIVNINKESGRKKQVEGLNSKLKTLNEDLGKSVAERTKELHTAKLHSETILENLTLGVVEYDFNFKILRLNRAAEQFLGIERRSVIGVTIKPKNKNSEKLSSLSMVLYPALSKKGRRIKLKEEFETEVRKNEIVIDHPRKRNLHITTVQLKGLYATEKSRYVKLIRDITHKKMVDRHKSEFIRIAAHQLRTPLSGTKWALCTILDEDLGEITPHQKELLLRTYNANQNLISIINDLLDVAHIEERALEYRKERNDITKVIEEVLNGSMVLIKDKKINITFKKDSFESTLFPFDRSKIMLALKNIIGNAIDYTPSGREITITLKKEGVWVIVEVIDTGMGISKEDQENVFTKFYRSKEAKKVEKERSGTGLWISKKIVKGHDGTITIESKEGEGTKVIIKLPVVTTLASDAS